MKWVFDSIKKTTSLKFGKQFKERGIVEYVGNKLFGISLFLVVFAIFLSQSGLF